MTMGHRKKKMTGNFTANSLHRHREHTYGQQGGKEGGGRQEDLETGTDVHTLQMTRESPLNSTGSSAQRRGPLGGKQIQERGYIELTHLAVQQKLPQQWATLL